jgi:hypothetical protein
VEGVVMVDPATDVYTFLNYGIAGLILWAFYRLISNELAHLKEAIDKMNETMNKMSQVIEKHNILLDNLLKKFNNR